MGLPARVGYFSVCVWVCGCVVCGCACVCVWGYEWVGVVGVVVLSN